jgi:hypothetical protein
MLPSLSQSRPLECFHSYECHPEFDVFICSYRSYEVILYVISIEEIIQPKVGQSSKCVPGLATILFETVKNSGSTDANNFCLYNPIDVHIYYNSHLLDLLLGYVRTFSSFTSFCIASSDVDKCVNDELVWVSMDAVVV